MASYVVAHLTVHDWERYALYGAGFFGPLDRYGGKVLMADDDLEVPLQPRSYDRRRGPRPPGRLAPIAPWSCPSPLSSR